MPGMNRGLNAGNPTVVAAFKAALMHQGLQALLIFAVLGFVWFTVRTWPPAAAPADAGGGAGTPRPGPARPGPGRTRLAPAAPDRLRPAVDLRRGSAGPAEDGGGPSLAGHRAHRSQLAGLGAAPGEPGRNDLVVSPDAGRGLGGVDPGRDRHLGGYRGPGGLD